MATITAETVKALRELSGAGVMECKRALEETDGDIEKAAAILQGARPGRCRQARRPRGQRRPRFASYIHPGSKIGVLIEVNCETDFVAARTSSRSSSATWPSRLPACGRSTRRSTPIPADELEAKRAALLADEGTAKKPEAIRAQIVDGQLKKWFAEVVLMEQPFRDQDRTVGELVTEAIAKTGENIKVRRFVRFELGE